MQITNEARNATLKSLAGGVVGGAIFGACIGAPVLLTSAIFGINSIVSSALGNYVSDLAKKNNWDNSKLCFVKAGIFAPLFIITITTQVALGIIASTGATVFGIIGLGITSMFLMNGYNHLKLEKAKEVLA